jgi:hypothetical protein
MKEENNDISDLSEVIKVALEKKGVIGSIKSKLRSEIFKILNDDNEPNPDKPLSTNLSIALIKDFMNFFHLDSSLAVFNDEVGFDADTDKSKLATALGFRLENNSLPLLVLLIEHLLETEAGS